MIDELLGHDVVFRLAWCLVSSLWQSTAIALVAAALRLVLPRTAQVRYWLAVAALAAMFVAPVLTFVAGMPSAAMNLAPLHVDAGGSVAPITSMSIPASFSAPAWTGWLTLAWLAGVLVCSLRLLVGWTAARALLARPRLPVPASIERLFADLRETLGVRGRVRLVLGESFGAPAVIGWLQPVIWLPFVAVTGLSAEQLRAVLAHELAHVRRHDFLVNVLQRCVESLLFYHPAVWLVSSTIRAEREHCCDDAALAICGDRLTYAAALVELEVARSAVPRLAVAATGGRLLQRVQRVLGRDSQQRDWRDLIAVCTLTGVLLVMAACQSTRLAAQPSPPAAPPPPATTLPAPATPVGPPAVAVPQPPSSPTPAAPAAAAPAPPAVVQLPAPAFTSYFARERPWALFYRDRTMFGGTADDRRTARTVHDSLSRDLLWFRDRGTAYVVTDAATLQKVADFFAPLEQLGQEQRQLGEQQRQLGQQQRQLGEEMRTAAATVPDLSPRLKELRDSVAKLDLKPQASSQEFAALQASLASLQGQLGRLQGEIGKRQGEIGRQQGQLGRQQGEIGRRQGDLGRQQAKAARQAEDELNALLRASIESGLAKRQSTDL